MGSVHGGNTRTCHRFGNCAPRIVYAQTSYARTRHNDNDDAPVFFFFFAVIISVYDELPLWGALMQGEVYRVSMQSMWPVVVHLMGIGRLHSKPPETWNV